MVRFFILIIFFCYFSNSLNAETFNKINPENTIKVYYEEINIEEILSSEFKFWIDSNNAWIGLSRTRDGGKRWERMVITKDMIKKWFNSEEWQKVFENHLDLIYEFAQVYFVNNKKGFLQLILKDYNGLWATDDGGENWYKVGDIMFTKMSFKNEKTGWMIISENDGYRPYITKDGGNTWQKCEKIYNNFDFEPNNNMNNEYYWAIIWKKEKEKSNYGLAYTNDEGCNWQIKSLFPKEHKYIRDFQFLNEQEGFAITDLGIIYTDSSGKNWREINASIRNGISIFFKNRREGWIATVNGIYFTNDYGKKFKKLTKEEILKGFPDVINGRLWKYGNMYSILEKYENEKQ